jgi:hypothetical protein
VYSCTNGSEEGWERNIQSDGHTGQPFPRRRVLRSIVDLLPERQVVECSSSCELGFEGKTGHLVEDEV